MMGPLQGFFVNRASAPEVEAHLRALGPGLAPSLDDAFLLLYAEKITCHAMRFECWEGGSLIGLVACYCNDLDSGTAFITHVGILAAHRGHGLAAHLLGQALLHAARAGFRSLRLEVQDSNDSALALYRKFGFVLEGSLGVTQRLHLHLEPGASCESIAKLR